MQPASQPGSAGLPGAEWVVTRMLSRWRSRRALRKGNKKLWVKLLSHRDWRVRDLAGRMLAELGEEGVAALSDVVRTSRDPAARLAAVTALAQSGRPSAIPALLDAAGDEEGVIRREATWALEQLGAEGEAEILRGLEDRRWWVRKAAAWALWTKGEHVAPPLEETLGRDEDAAVRRTAAWALGKIGAQRSVSPLAESLHDEDPSVRAAASWALGRLGEAAHRALFVAARDAEWWVRRAATWALGEARIGESATLLLERLSDEHPSVRAAAAWSLGALKSQEALIPLLRAAGDADPKVRREAVLALSALDVANSRIEVVLRQASRDPSGIVRRAAMMALRSREERAAPK
jgi:HEAT repeat protein